MKRKILKSLLVVVVFAFLFSIVYSLYFSFSSDSPSSDSSDYVIFTTPNGEEKHLYTDSEAFEEHAQEIIEERKKALQTSYKPLTAHAEKTAFYQELQDNTRFNDKWLNNSAASGVGLGIDLATQFLQIDTTGETDELVIKSYYECAGKVGLTYLSYVDREWVPVLTEVVTCYAPEVPWRSDYGYFAGVVTPPTYPNWSLRSIEPNELCYMRELDTGDVSYFIYRPGASTNVPVDAISYNGTVPNSYDLASGVRFTYDSNFQASVEDSSGVHTFQTSAEDVNIYFITSDVNTIFTESTKQYTDQFYTNLTLANNCSFFFCSYLITNDPPEKQDVVSTINVNNNWTYNQYPIYRLSNTNLQTTYHSDNYDNRHFLTQNVLNEYQSIGFDYDSNLQKFDIDYDTLSAAINNTFAPEFQAAFDSVYSAQPQIGYEFNANNNTLNYPDLIVDNSGDTAIHVYWDYPQYESLDSVVSGSTSDLPDINVTGFVPDYSNYTSETIPVDVISNSKAVVDIGWNLFDSLGLIPFIIPLVLLAILWKLTGGD